MNNIMLDIETLGKKQGCIVTQIAAVPFSDTGTADRKDCFLAAPDITSFGTGFHVDASTLKWALVNGVTILHADARPARHIFEELAEWFRQRMTNRVRVWAKSPSFDCEIIEAVWRKFDIETPWHYWQLMDVRTELRDEGRPQKPVAHDAMEDCIDQIAALHRKWNRTRLASANLYAPAN